MSNTSNGAFRPSTETRVLARQYVFVSTCKLPSSLDYVYRPGIGSRRRFAIVIKTIEMYSLDMHSVPL